MPAGWKTVRWPLVAEMDTKIDGVNLMMPSKLASCRNAFIDKTSRIRKRRGLASLSTVTVDNTTISPPIALGKYRSSAVAFAAETNGSSYEWSDTLQRWTTHAKYIPGFTEAMQISTVSRPSDQLSAGVGTYKVDCATANGYTLYAQVEVGSLPVVTTVRVTLVDSKGTFLCNRLALKTAGASSTTGAVGERYTVRVVAIGNVFYVVWNLEATRDICTWILDTTSASTITTAIGSDAATPANAVTTAADLRNLPNIAAFDVAPSGSNGVYIAYRETGDAIKTGFINSSGALVNTSNLTPTNTPKMIGVDVLGNNHAVVYINQQASDVFAVLRTWNGSTWTTVQTSLAMQTFTGGTAINICCRWDSATVLRLFYTADNVALGNDTATAKVYQATYDTSNNVVAPAVVLRRSHLCSRPQIAADGKLYFWVFQGLHLGAVSNRTYHFLVEASTGKPVTAMHAGIAGYFGSGLGVNYQDLTSLIVTGSSLTAALLFFVRGGPTQNGDPTGSNRLGIRSVSWSLANPAGKFRQNFKTVEAAGSLYMGGGLPQQYDGVRWTETGFLVTTEMEVVRMTKAAGGSMTPLAQYWYRIIPEWMNARGIREQGFDSGPVSVTMGAGDTQVTLDIPTYQMTYKTDVDNAESIQTTSKMNRVGLSYAIYRSAPNPATNVTQYYRVGTCFQDGGLNDQASFIDQIADSEAAKQESYYRSAGEVQHNAPPPCVILAEGNDRLFMAGVPDEPFTVWPSAQRSFDQAVHFSEELKITLPEIGGKIIALAVMNDTLLVFKERAIYRVRGSGPSNTLATGTFLPGEIIATEIGCVSQRSVLVTPMGTVFLSTRGFFVVQPDHQVVYISPQLEGLTGADSPTDVANDLNGAVVLKFEQQIRWTSPTRVWLFDYYHRSWSVYDNQTINGPSMDYNDRHLWPGASTAEREDDATLFQAADWKIRTGKLKLGPDFILRFVGITGDVVTAASLRIDAYVDGGTTPIEVVDTSALLPGLAKTWDRMPSDYSIVEMVEFEISDNGTGNAGSIALSEIVLEVGERGRTMGVRR